MARKPAHIVAKIAVQMPYGQDGVWQVIRERKAGVLTDILERVAADRRTVTGYLERLRKGGFVGPADGADEWRLLIDQPDTPRLRRDGSLAADTGRGQDNMWRTMKMLDRFTAADLARLASTDAVTVKTAAAESYIKHLYRAGYLNLEIASKPGSRAAAGRKAAYSLRPAMNTGPLPPQVQRTDWVWDPNTLRALAPTAQTREGVHGEF